MLALHIQNETDRLKAVVLGTAEQNGPTPKIEEAYDPKSAEHILAGTYPSEENMTAEMDAFEKVLKKYDVTVYRPKIIPNVNQIFTRDIAFVIDDTLIKSNILPDREAEINAIEDVLQQITPEKIVQTTPDTHFEGGDVMLWNEYVFVGYYSGADYKAQITARTNEKGVLFIKNQFPHKKVLAFDLIKSRTDARKNALHLDCVFQPVGNNKAIIHPEGFRNPNELQTLIKLFGKENLFVISADEMYQMYSNVFSIDTHVVVSERHFTRLNRWLREQGFTVEEIPYAEISKQEGLLRCSTLPLIRERT
ncbi:MAG: amidinotransferase [Bacteroidetes bacterium]|nr:amidinotransferase [Bacteroidota bacterium]